MAPALSLFHDPIGALLPFAKRRREKSNLFVLVLNVRKSDTQYLHVQPTRVERKYVAFGVLIRVRGSLQPLHAASFPGMLTHMVSP